MEKKYDLNQLVYAKVGNINRILIKYDNVYESVTNYKDGKRNYIAEDVEVISSFLKYLYDRGVMTSIIKNGDIQYKLSINEIYNILELANRSEVLSQETSNYINEVGITVFMSCFYHMYNCLKDDEKEKLVLLGNNVEKIVKDFVRCDLLSNQYFIDYEIVKRDSYANYKLVTLAKLLNVDISKIKDFKIIYSQDGVQCFDELGNCYHEEKKNKKLLDNEKIKRYTK